jgi:hypothetical protein
LLFINSHIKYIKGVLVITTQDLKKRNQYWRELWDFIVLAKLIFIKSVRYLGELYSKQNKNKLRNNPRHLAYYILL